MTSTDRLLEIVIALEEQGWQRAADLAERLDVSTRTIYRDVEALAEAGVPVVGVPGKGYRLSETYFLPSISLTNDEAVLLLLSIEDVDRRLGTNYQAAAAAVRKKLDALLPDRLRSEATTLQQSLRFEPVNAFDDPAEQQALDRLRDALAERRAVRFWDRHTQERRLVLPYGLVHLGGTWHLVGYDRPRECVQHVRLDRMEAIEVLGETFERPAGYAQQPGTSTMPRDRTVRVLFDGEVARWVQQASSTYVVETGEAAEGLLVTLKVQRETEVLPWLLSWGAHAHVLEPVSLRRRLAREAEQIAARYQDEPTLLS